MPPISQLGYLLQHTAGIMQRQADQVLQERLGIGMSQYKILMMLQRVPDTQQRTLADGLGQTEASISRQIKLLQEKGMLVTTVNASNHRQHVTTITPKGIRIGEAARDILMQGLAGLLPELGDKRLQQFIEMLGQLHRNVCEPGRPFACDFPFGL
jgi:DNA-binding MarR family transcriptional regulator